MGVLLPSWRFKPLREGKRKDATRSLEERNSPFFNCDEKAGTLERDKAR